MEDGSVIKMVYGLCGVVRCVVRETTRYPGRIENRDYSLPVLLTDWILSEPLSPMISGFVGYFRRPFSISNFLLK